jgi:hypothetical protein
MKLVFSRHECLSSGSYRAPPLIDSHVAVVTALPREHQLSSESLFGKPGSVRTVGPCAVYAQAPMGLSISTDRHDDMIAHEVLLSSDSDPPSRSKPGVVLLIAELGKKGETTAFIEALVQRAHPTNACPTQITIAFLPDIPAPVIVPMLRNAGAADMRLLGRSSPYVLTLCRDVSSELGEYMTMTTPMRVHAASLRYIKTSNQSRSPNPKMVAPLSAPEEEGDFEVSESDSETEHESEGEAANERLDEEGERESEGEAATERPSLNETTQPAVSDWDLRHYDMKEFCHYYGEDRGVFLWRAALHASGEAKKAVQYLKAADTVTVQSLWFVLSSWLPASPTVTEAYDVILAAFYVGILSP